MAGNQPIIQVDYEILLQLAQHFDDCGQPVQKGYTAIMEQVGRLRVGEWQGDAATLFYTSMNQDVLPAIERLKIAFHASHDTLQEIVRLFQSADEEAAALLKLNESETDGTGVATGQARGGGTPRRRRLRQPPSQGNGPQQGGGNYPDPRDYLNRYNDTNVGDWIAAPFRGGYVTDYDEEALARDLFNEYMVTNNPRDWQFALDVLGELGQPRQEEVFNELSKYLLDGDFAANLGTTRAGRVFAMGLINEMNEPWFLPNSSPYGGVPTPLYMNKDVRNDFIRQVFPDMVTLENEPWFNGSYASDFQANANAVNGEFQLLNDRGGDVVYDRFEVTIQVPIDADINGYFSNILENGPSVIPQENTLDFGVVQAGFNDITPFSPNTNATSFAPIVNNTGLGSVFDIDFLSNAQLLEEPLNLFRGDIDGGVMMVDSNFVLDPQAPSGSFTFQAMTIENRSLLEYGPRQFGYTVDGIATDGQSMIVTIYTQSASRPSDMLSEGDLTFGIGGDIFQPQAWELWFQDIGYDATNRRWPDGEVVGYSSFTTNQTD